jgi:glycosyltransferase involved in cell wall biosynthesis
MTVETKNASGLRLVEVGAEAEAVSLSVVVPAKDEEESLPILVQGIVDTCAGAGLPLNEIVLVDDGSRDGTWAAMTRLAETSPVVRAIRLRRNFGKATALSAGIASATGTVVITMDADLQDDPKEIPRFVELIRSGNDVVSGWKEKRNDPLSKTLPSRLFNWVTARTSGVPLHDFNCGFKAYRREVFDTVELYGELHRYVPVLAHALGYRVAELSVLHHARRFGVSKYGVARFLRGFLDLLTVMMITRYAYRPGHLFGGFGTVFFILGGGILAYLSALKLVTGASIGERPLLLFGVMVVIIGIQLLLFGLLAELVISRTPRAVETDDLVRSRAGEPR